MNTTPKSVLPAHGGMMGVAIFYSINYFTLKEVFNSGLDSFAVLSLRLIVCTSLFVVFHAVFIKEKIRDKKDYLYLFMCSIFGVAANQTFFLWGISKTVPVNASVLMITAPVFVFIVAAALRQETFSLYKIAGLIISFFGAYILIDQSSAEGFTLSNDTLVGDLMIVINAAFYGTYLVLIRPMIRKYNVFTIVKWVFLFGTIIAAPAGIQGMISIDYLSLAPNVVFGLVFLIVFATLGAYGLNAWAMKRVNSSAVGMYIYLQPIFVTIITALFFAEALSMTKLFCIVVIFTGVFLVIRVPEKKAILHDVEV